VPGELSLNSAPYAVLFERYAPQLAHSALDNLSLTQEERRSITHVIVTSCTGLYAPGLDFEVVNPSRACPVGRTNHDRLHGMLRSNQRAQVGTSHRSLGAGSRGSGIES
jgi:hypothetical protein